MAQGFYLLLYVSKKWAMAPNLRLKASQLHSCHTLPWKWCVKNFIAKRGIVWHSRSVQHVASSDTSQIAQQTAREQIWLSECPNAMHAMNLLFLYSPCSHTLSHHDTSLLHPIRLICGTALKTTTLILSGLSNISKRHSNFFWIERSIGCYVPEHFLVRTRN